MEKKFCSIHHLYYSSSRCPLCESERSEAMAKRYYREPKPVKNEEKPKEISEDALLALKEKFNCH